MGSFSLPTDMVSAALSEVELRRLEAADRHERKFYRTRRSNLLGMGPTYDSLFDLVTAHSNELIDGRLYWVQTEPTEDALNDLIADLTLQYEAHRVDGAVHAGADGVNTLVANGGAAVYVYGDIGAQRTQLNAIKAAFNAHAPTVAGPVHAAADNDNVCLQADVAAGDKTGAWLLANALRVAFAAHWADTAAHTIADVTNVVTVAAISSAVATNDVKALFRWEESDSSTLEADRVLRAQGLPATSAGRFIRADLDHDAEAGFGGAYENLWDLVNEDPGKLRDGGLYWVGLSPSMLALNNLIADLTLQYEAHRVDAAAHIGADGVNTIVGAGGAAVYVPGNVAAAATQLNAIQTAFNAHCGTAGGVHTAADAVNVSTMAAAGASDLVGLWRLANELRADYEAHRVVSPAVHPAPDATAVVTVAAISDAVATTEVLATYQWRDTDATTEARLSTLPLYAPRAAGRFRRCDLSGYMGQGPNVFHAIAGSVLDYLRFKDGQVYEFKNFTTLYALETGCADLWAMYEAHRVLVGGGEHGAPDGVNTLAAYTPSDLKSHTDMLVDFKANFNAHCGTVGGVHGAADTVNLVTYPDITDYDLFGAWALYNECWADYEAHRVNVTGGVHGAPDGTNVMTETQLDDATQWNVIDGTYRWEENCAVAPNNLQILQLPYCPDGGRFVAERGDDVRCMGELIAPGTNIHAQGAGGGGAFNWVAGFTVPTPRRNFQAVCSNNGGWSNCNLTITGTDQDGNTIAEVLALTAGATVVGRRVYHTVTSMVTSGDIGGGETLDVQAAERIYIGPFAEMLGVAADEVDETATSTWIGQEGWYEAATVQNANVVFHVFFQAFR